MNLEKTKGESKGSHGRGEERRGEEGRDRERRGKEGGS